MLALLLAVWIDFAPCGQDYTNGEREQFVPAPDLERFRVRRSAIIGLLEHKQVPGSLACTLIFLANGERLIVVGTFEDISKQVIGARDE